MSLARVAMRAGTTRVGVRWMSNQVPAVLNEPLKDTDPEMFELIEQEKRRLRNTLSLIASENFASRSIFDTLGSVMQNKYSEGYPAARYYGGNEFIDQGELLCQKRALETFKLNPDEWGCNVQAHSGSPANLAVLTAVVKPGGRLMGLDLPHGGHLSHGYQIPGKKISASSMFFESLPYRVNEETGLIDYDRLEENAMLYRPAVLIAGGSGYSRHIDYARMRAIADKCGAYLLMDMAHISGLIAGGVLPSPFEHAHLVTTTTHKGLRGPRGALIFYRKGVQSVSKTGVEKHYDFHTTVNQAVFPGLQGGPHNHSICAIAVALKQAQSPEYAQYQRNVVANCKSFVSHLQGRGWSFVSGGSDNHLCIADMRALNLDGARCERVFEMVNISINKNTVPGDVSALVPSGIRIGTPAMTTRGMDSEDFKTAGDFLHRACEIASQINNKAEKKTLKSFKEALDSGDHGIEALKTEVSEFAASFPTIGYSVEDMKYK